MDAGVIASGVCSISMTAFTASPFLLVKGDAIKATLEVYYGMNTYSMASAESTSFVTVKIPPTASPVPFRGVSTTQT
jgi:hypothetical protein